VSVGPWVRMHWAIVFKTNFDRYSMIGTTWDKRGREVPKTEPTRPLLFRTRKQAVDWCREQNAYWHSTDYGKKWRVKPVRVIESVSIR
jgi:hypothetical protein